MCWQWSARDIAQLRSPISWQRNNGIVLSQWSEHKAHILVSTRELFSGRKSVGSADREDGGTVTTWCPKAAVDSPKRPVAPITRLPVRSLPPMTTHRGHIRRLSHVKRSCVCDDKHRLPWTNCLHATVGRPAHQDHLMWLHLPHLHIASIVHVCVYKDQHTR